MEKAYYTGRNLNKVDAKTFLTGKALGKGINFAGSKEIVRPDFVEIYAIIPNYDVDFN